MPSAKPFEPYTERLRTELLHLEAEMLAVLDRSIIRNVDPNTGDSGLFFLNAADWGWDPGDGTTVLRMTLLGRFRQWFSRFRLLFPHPTPDVSRRLSDAGEFVVRWLERPDTWDHEIPRTTDQAKSVAGQRFRELEGLFDLLGNEDPVKLRLVPDANALISNPELASYDRVAGQKDFVVHLVPTVLGEIDDLKDRGRSQDLREKAQAVVRRLKGLRDKGRLADGVNLTKGIVVRAEHREVDPPTVLEWLDAAVPDDRILANALALQSAHPASVVVLVTSDLNLQNKADAAGLPYVETPPHPSSLAAGLTPRIAFRTTVSGERVRVAEVSNAGPAVAREVEYRVESPAGGRPKYTGGPWKAGTVKPGETTSNDLYGFYPDRVEVIAAWTDDAGQHERQWIVENP